MMLNTTGRRGRRRAQEGSALLLALVLLAVMVIGVSALVALTTTNHAASRIYRSERTTRYAGDSAVQAAVNWAKDQPRVGRDPALDSTDPACVYQVPTSVGSVTVSCAATAKMSSGAPKEGGLVPPEALLLLGTRDIQPGPLNAPACTGWWDTFTGWFANGVDPDATSAYSEPGALFKKRNGLGVLGAACNVDRTRSMQNFKIRGNMVAAGRIVVPNGAVTMISPSSAKARTGTKIQADGSPLTIPECSGGGLTCTTPGTRSGMTGALAYLNGTAEDSDPARPTSPSANPMDLKAPWLPINFNQDGSPVDVAKLPERKTAYLWNAGTGVLTPTSTCSGVSTTIVFLPGWYRDASVLNNYTANNGCTGVTFWFAPDRGADGTLLTADDLSGVFYMDFRPPASGGYPAFGSYSNIACGPGGLMPATKSLWCIGGSSSQNPRVVVGTPKDWSPLGGSATGSGGDTRQRTAVTLSAAGTVDGDFSQVWHQKDNAKAIDGQLAFYKPAFTSNDRAIRVRDFTPNVTGAPIDDPGFPKGRIYLNVAYGLVNGTTVNAPVLEVAAVSKTSGTKNCGSFTLPKNVYSGTGPLPATYRFTDAQAKTLADNCSSTDLINGLQVTMKVTGDPFNIGVNLFSFTDTPNVYFDGVKIDYESFQGASFPAPISSGSQPAAAKSDCDPRFPGAQLVFGGESHVYVADGSLEVCAGPFPTDPENKLVTGVFQLPAVAPVTASAVANDGGDGNYDVLNKPNAAAIDGSFATIRYRSRCAEFCSGSTEGRVRLTMQPYAAPAGYTVSKIQAKVSYNPKNSGCFFLWSCPGEAPQLRPPRCGNIDFPKNPDKGVLQVDYMNSAVLYDATNGTNCLSPAELANASSPAQLVWAARADCPAGVCSAFGGGADYTDSLDGIELEVTLVPSDNTKPRLLPASGCIVSYPNYGGGEGRPDCAVLRADLNRIDDNNWTTTVLSAKEGQWLGRVSVKGTVYAPSAAVEVDDPDNAYPIATRGVVVRHLRMSGFGFRTNYDGMAIDTATDRTPTPRDALFTACTQSNARQTAKAPCDNAQGDRIITTARYRFDLDQSSSVPAQNKARVPNLVWWETK